MCRQLNIRCREGAFPLGTFVANVLGSLVMALVFYGTRNSSSLATGWSNVAIKAFQVGRGRLWRYPHFHNCCGTSSPAVVSRSGVFLVF